MTVSAPQSARPTVQRRARTPQTLIVGYDRSSESQAALRAAIERAGPDDTVTVVHGYAPVSGWIAFPYYGEAVVEAQSTARDVLEDAARIAEDSGVEVTLEMFEGAPAQVLRSIASQRRAREIIVGTRALGVVRGALGSVAQELIRTADRPVLVVPVDTSETA